MTTKSEYIDKYVSLIMEYLLLCSNSDAIKTSDIPNFIVRAGISAIDHIYSLAFSITNDLDSTAKYVNRGNCYFHEYLDQLNRSGMIQSVDCNDIVKFTYSKTVGEIYNGTNHTYNHGFKHCISSYVVGTILWCSNTNITDLQRHELSYMYLLPFLEYMCSDNQTFSPELIHLINDLQSWFPLMKYEDYCVLLGSMLKLMKRSKQGISNEMVRERRLYMIANWKGLSLDEIVHFEGYKTIADITYIK